MMSLFEDLKPFFHIARLLGFAPYKVCSADLPLSRAAVGYSGMCALCYAYLLYLRLEMLTSADVEMKLRFLTIVRTVLSECVLFVDIFVCIRWHRKLQTSLAYMQKYDHAVKIEPTPRANTIRCWLGLSLAAVYFLILGWLTYIYEAYRPLESSILYIVLYISTTFGIFKFTAIVASLLHRFRHLNRLLKADSSGNEAEIGRLRRQLHLRDVWCLHGCLVAAAKELNSLYSAQLLFWIAGLTFNIISRIYVFCDPNQFLGFVKVLREGGLAVAFICLLALLAGICHATAAEENIQIGLYFLFHQFNFTAALGFLRVDLPLLQTIAGTMTTYLVILKAPG